MDRQDVDGFSDRIEVHDRLTSLQLSLYLLTFLNERPFMFTVVSSFLQYVILDDPLQCFCRERVDIYFHGV